MKTFITAIVLLCTIFNGVAAPAQRIAVTSPLANIRSGPGTTYDILWNIEKYHPLVILETSGKWIRFRDFEGDQGWIHRSLVGKIDTVITLSDQCNIRSGPGTSHKILFVVGKGIPFKILKQKGNWLHIEHADGDNGWIHRSLVW